MAIFDQSIEMVALKIVKKDKDGNIIEEDDIHGEY